VRLGEGDFEVFPAAHAKNLQARLEGSRRELGGGQAALAVCRIPQERDARYLREGFFEQFHPLPWQPLVQSCQTGDVSAWPREARGHAEHYRVIVSKLK
jgi:hypothetical protein